MPVVEDGNNFGCDVQQHVYEGIKKSCTALQALQDSLASYYSDRGAAMEKVTSFPTKKVSSSSSKTSTTGGKVRRVLMFALPHSLPHTVLRCPCAQEEEAGEKTSTSESTESSATETAICEDHLEAVMMIDLKWYILYCYCQLYCRSVCVRVCLSLSLSLSLSRARAPPPRPRVTCVFSATGITR